MGNITLHVTLGSMPRLLEDVPVDLNDLVIERGVNQVQLWAIFMAYWPSLRLPPYTIPTGWIWVWHRVPGGIVWEVIGIR